MSHRYRLTLAAVLSFVPTLSARADDLTASGDLRWFRGNMHTHSHWSDGDDYLESIGLWYRDNGYDFLVFTDHNVVPTTERWVDVEKSKGGRRPIAATRSDTMRTASPGNRRLNEAE